MLREFLQLAKVFEPKKHGCAGYYLSEKLDGMRACWDGGITRGMPTSDVPWANTAKDKVETTATGLWSRYAKPIQVPSWWLDCLPPYPLDGELWLGRGTFQQLVSITKRTVNVLDTEWLDVKYCVFDSPSYTEIFLPGEIRNTNFKKVIGDDVLRWIKQRLLIDPRNVGGFKSTYAFLCDDLKDNKVIVVHEQLLLPHNTPMAREIIDQKLFEVSDLHGEGLMLRNPILGWYPKRCDTILKIKPLHDAEATVVGYRTGKTGKEGKLLGMMGSLVVNFNGRIFDLGGYTDSERTLSDTDWCIAHPGEVCPREITSPIFPYGTIVTFTYRELTDSGLPKEARFKRIIL